MTEPFRSRRFVAVPPGDRPVRSRRAVRVVVTDGERVLLLRDSDPGVPGLHWWITPGGGMDPGEQPLQTAVRELAEETGLRISPDALRGPLIRRFVIHGYSDQVLGQAELFYLLRVPEPFALDTSGFTEDEKLTIAAWDWLPIDALGTASEAVWPVDLAELIALDEHPDRWPLDHGVVEESTVGAEELGRRVTLDWAGSPDDWAGLPDPER
ncbi:MAG: NUDIX domain-containing protein [Micropruina sp.]|uniref:NUDIX hydrolase n=1 Tax=Micropruina sp. TaxID=2737536 RepID=UPI0039E276F3